VANVPETRYTKTFDGLHIAYQVTGEGPIDLLFNVGLISHVEAAWELAAHAQFFRRLASFSRLIRFDKRGSGLSDPVSRAATLEERMDDMRAVLDAVGSEHAVLIGISEGGAMAMLFAAVYPERTSALVLYGTGARVCRAPDYDCGFERAFAEQVVASAVEGWGRPGGRLFKILAPGAASDPRLQELWAHYERLAASPGQFADATSMNFDIDIRSVLPTIHAPTLVVHRDDDLLFPVCHGRYLAEHIPGAKLRVLPGSDHLFCFGDADGIADEIEEFLVGARHTREPDRVLSTILFTDIVGSTQRASALGDRRWGDLLDRHDELVRRQLAHFGGREINTLGDGFVASFDGPARAVRCARTITAEVPSLDLEVRAGVHTGECEVRGNDLAGIAVHVAARVGALAPSGEVLVSSTVRDLVAGSGIRFVERGTHVLKGVPEEWRLFAVESV